MVAAICPLMMAVVSIASVTSGNIPSSARIYVPYPLILAKVRLELQVTGVSGKQTAKHHKPFDPQT